MLPSAISMLVVLCTLGRSAIGDYGYGHHGGTGHRGGGGGYPHSYNHHHYDNSETGYRDPVNVQEEGCARPEFTDSAQFEIEGCKLNTRPDYCRNNLRIPTGKSAVMSCIRGRRLIRLTTKCQSDACWNPTIPPNCNDLFELLATVKGTTNNPEEPEYQKPEARNCPRVNVNQMQTFIITCQFPEGFAYTQATSKDDDCMSQFPKGVPSGTRISVSCRPPSSSFEAEPNNLLCKDGRWEGKTQNIICKVPKKEGVPERPKNPEPPTTNPVENPTPTPLPMLPTTSTEKTGLTSTCVPLKARAGVELSCVWSGTEVRTNECQTRVPTGTEARYSCANYYETTAALPTVYRKCKPDGTWSGSSDFNCVVACGRDNAVKVAYITNSLPTLQGQWPWHVALFRKRPSDEESWEYICGGTLITKKAIITAGHCVTMLQTSKLVSTDDIQVHLGKYRREVTDEHVQIKQVDQIIVNPNYNPYNYDSDLALLILKNEVTIGHFVRPICFLTVSDSALEDLQLSDNSTGTVVGWGYDENNKLADDLRMAHLKVVGSRECAKSMMGSSITQLNTRSTTFCAGYANGTNVCNGDSGSGMYFPTVDTDNTRWYLQGLVSVGIVLSSGRCNPNAFSVFTRLGRYADFITRTLSEHDAL